MGFKGGLAAKILVISLIVGAASVSVAYGYNIILRYKFESVDKKQGITLQNGSEQSDSKRDFTAEPKNMIDENWLTKLAGGTDKNLVVSIGEVIYDNNGEFKELYMDLQGESEKLTLIANGASYTYYGDTQQVKRMEVNFLTGKRLDGKEVIKDYSEGKDKVILVMDFNENQDIVSRVLFMENDVDYSDGIPSVNYYSIN